MPNRPAADFRNNRQRSFVLRLSDEPQDAINHFAAESFGDHFGHRIALIDQQIEQLVYCGVSEAQIILVAGKTAQ